MKSLKFLLMTLFLYSNPLFAQIYNQDYSYQETLPIEEYHYPSYKGIYVKAEKLLNEYMKDNGLTEPTGVLVNVMAFRINLALRYMGLAAFTAQGNYQEVKLRIQAIENACIKHGIYISPRNINIEYNNLYGETAYAVYYKAMPKPKNWSGKKSKKVETLQNTFVVKDHSSMDSKSIVKTK